MIKIDMEISQDYLGDWRAIDLNRYDVDCDADGYYSVGAVGWGLTPWEAAIDLIDQLEAEEAETKVE